MAYIYMTTNLVNGKRYIGKSCHHSSKTKHYLGGGKLIQHAVKKYGKPSFSKCIIVEGDFNNNLLDDLERHYIQLYAAQTRSDFYNLASGGEGGKPLSSYYPTTTIYRFDHNGIFIKEYTTTFAELGRKLGLTTSNVIAACRTCKYSYTIRGYLSLYPYLPSLDKSRQKGIAVDVYDREGEFLGEFLSIPEASKALNFSKKKLGSALDTGGLTDNKFYVLEQGQTKPITFIECISTTTEDTYYFMTFIEALKFISKNNSFTSLRYKELHNAIDTCVPYKGFLFRYVTSLLCH